MTTPKTRREQEFEAFKKAWEEYPSQDNEGFVPDRGGFKCGWFAALRWADSTPAPSEQEDEEYFKRINYFVWNYCDRDQRLTAESAFAQVLCDALNNARRAQNAEVERLKKELSWHRTQHGKDLVKTVGDVHGVLVSENQELRSLLERAKGFADFVFGYNTTNGINPKYELEWLSDYAKLTSNAAQGGDEEAANKYWREHRDFHDSDGVDVCQVFKDGAAHARRTQAAEIQKLKARLSNAIDDYIEMQNKISGMYSEKEVETRIAEAVKRERARILDVARNWTGCKYCSTGETLKELVHPAPSNEWDRDG